MKLLVESDGLIGSEVSADQVSPHFGALRSGVVITLTFINRLVSQWQRLAAGHP